MPEDFLITVFAVAECASFVGVGEYDKYDGDGLTVIAVVGLDAVAHLQLGFAAPLISRSVGGNVVDISICNIDDLLVAGVGRAGLQASQGDSVAIDGSNIVVALCRACDFLGGKCAVNCLDHIALQLQAECQRQVILHCAVQSSCQLDVLGLDCLSLALGSNFEVVVAVLSGLTLGMTGSSVDLHGVLQPVSRRTGLTLEDPRILHLTKAVVDGLDAVAGTKIGALTRSFVVNTGEVVDSHLGHIHVCLSAGGTVLEQPSLIDGIIANCMDTGQVLITNGECVGVIRLGNNALAIDTQGHSSRIVGIDLLCDLLVLGLDGDEASLAHLDHLVDIPTVGIGLTGSIAVYIPVQAGTFLVTSGNINVSYFASGVLVTTDTVAFAQGCLDTLVFAVTGHVVDFAIRSQNTVQVYTGGAFTGHNGIHVGSDKVAVTVRPVTGNTSRVINLQNDIAAEQQAHTTVIGSIHIVCDRLIAGAVLSNLTLHSQLKDIPTIRIGYTRGSLCLRVVLLVNVEVHGAINIAVGNEDDLGVAHRVRNDVDQVTFLQLGLFTEGFSSRVDVIDLGIFAQDAGISTTNLSTGNQSFGRNHIAVNAHDVIVVCCQLTTNCVSCAEAVDNVTFLVEHQRAASADEAVGIDGIDDQLFLGTQSNELSVCEEINIPIAVLSLFTSGALIGAVVETLNTPVNLRLVGTIVDKSCHGSVLICTIDDHTVHDLQLVQRTHHEIATGNLGSCLNDIVYRNILTQGDRSFQTVIGLCGVQQNLLTLNVLNECAVCDHGILLGGVKCIHNNTVLIEGQAQHLHAVDSVDKSLVCNSILFDLSANRETDIIQTVLSGFTDRQHRFRIQHGLLIHIHIEVGVNDLLLLFLLRLVLRQYEQEYRSDSGSHDHNAQNNPKPQQTFFAGSFFFHSNKTPFRSILGQVSSTVSSADMAKKGRTPPIPFLPLYHTIISLHLQGKFFIFLKK